MDDYISRQKAISMFAELQELAHNRVCDTPTDSPCYMRYVTQAHERDDAVRRLMDLPAADVQQVVRGRWERFSPGWLRCDQCGGGSTASTSFCPGCGAKMRKGGIAHVSCGANNQT